MPRQGRLQITPLSAAYSLVSWIEGHGYEPHAKDCRNRVGLLGYDTYYRCLRSSVHYSANFSAIVSYARDLVAADRAHQMSSNFSPLTYRCLRCDRSFPKEAAHIRLCAWCRRRQGSHPSEPLDEPMVVRSQMKFFGLENLWDWENDIDWSHT